MIAALKTSAVRLNSMHSGLTLGGAEKCLLQASVCPPVIPPESKGLHK